MWFEKSKSAWSICNLDLLWGIHACDMSVLICFIDHLTHTLHTNLAVAQISYVFFLHVWAQALQLVWVWVWSSDNCLNHYPERLLWVDLKYGNRMKWNNWERTLDLGTQDQLDEFSLLCMSLIGNLMFNIHMDCQGARFISRWPRSPNTPNTLIHY